MVFIPLILVIIPAVNDGIDAAVEDRREEHPVRDPDWDEGGRLWLQYFPKKLQIFFFILFTKTLSADSIWSKKHKRES